MKEINQYIIEKFKISKNTISSAFPEKYILDEKGYTKLNKLFDSSFRKAGYSSYECELLTKTFRSKDTCIKYWIALLNLTNSIPYKYKGTVYSFPGNYGKPFIDALFDKFDLSFSEIDELLSLYEASKNIYKKLPFPKLLEESYNSKVESIINLSQYKDKLSYDLVFYENINDYSESTKEIFENSKGSVIIPFIVKYKNKEFKCEVIVRGSAYFNYKFEDKDSKLSSKFITMLDVEITKS